MTTIVVSSRASEVFRRTGSWETTLRVLRDEGFSKVDSVRATVEVLGLPLADAKVLVHRSEAWADRRDGDEQFHAALDARSPSDGA